MGRANRCNRNDIERIDCAVFPVRLPAGSLQEKCDNKEMPLPYGDYIYSVNATGAGRQRRLVVASAIVSGPASAETESVVTGAVGLVVRLSRTPRNIDSHIGQWARTVEDSA